MKHFVNAEFYATGVIHTNYRNMVDELKVGMKVGLLRDPANKFDPHATMIVALGQQIGWVPQKPGTSQLVAKALDAGAKLVVKITKLNPDSKWRQLKVWIRDELTAQGTTADLPLTEGDDDVIPY